MKAVVYIIGVVLLVNALTAVDAGRCDHVPCTYEAPRPICGVWGPLRRKFPDGSCQMRRHNCKYFTQYHPESIEEC